MVPSDLITGYWLVGLEEVNWVDMGPLGDFRFHDYPAKHNTFARNCEHPGTILVHRMTPERWQRDFDPMTCNLNCKLEEEKEEEEEGKKKEPEQIEGGGETPPEGEKNDG